LANWDEATYAEVVHEATANGSYLNFTWNGEPYLKKPPALFWMMAGSFKLLGESEWAARLPSAVMGVGTLLILYFSASAVAGRLAGIFAGLLPLGFYFFIARGGRECATDPPLIFFSVVAIFGLTMARTNRVWLVLVGPACGLAILSKGLAGFIPLAVVAISTLALPGFSPIGIRALITQSFIATTVAAPWFVYQAITNGALFWSSFVKQETLLRVASHLEEEPTIAYFTLRTFLNEIRHLWPLLFPLAGLTARTAGRGLIPTLLRLRPALMVWLVWLVVALSAACAVQTKLGWYVLPALMPVALIGGCILGAAFTQRNPTSYYCLPLGTFAIAMLIAGTPRRWRSIEQFLQTQRDRSRPSAIMGTQARQLAFERGGGELFFAGASMPTLVYYSGLHCHFVSAAHPEFELTDLGGSPISVRYHELVIRTADGEVTAIGNLDEEWNRSGPYLERMPSPGLRAGLEDR